VAGHIQLNVLLVSTSVLLGLKRAPLKISYYLILPSPLEVAEHYSLPPCPVLAIPTAAGRPFRFSAATSNAAATSNTIHPERSRSALFAFSPPPVMQCGNRGKPGHQASKRRVRDESHGAATLAPFTPPATPVIPSVAGRRFCFSASFLRSSQPAQSRDLSFIALGFAYFKPENRRKGF
jgi:hypothetical protein